MKFSKIDLMYRPRPNPDWYWVIMSYVSWTIVFMWALS